MLARGLLLAYRGTPAYRACDNSIPSTMSEAASKPAKPSDMAADSTPGTSASQASTDEGKVVKDKKDDDWDDTPAVADPDYPTHLTDSRIRQQETCMGEAHSLAESMEAMTHEHPSYERHFNALVLDLAQAKKKFYGKREIERIQLMSEALSGMLTVRSLFDDLRNRKIAPKSTEDPLAYTMVFEDRVVRCIKYFAVEIQMYATLISVPPPVALVPVPPSESAPPSANSAATKTSDAKTGSTSRGDPDTTPSSASSVTTSTTAVTAPPLTDEEYARKLQAEEDAEYAKLVSRRVYYYRATPVGANASGPGSGGVGGGSSDGSAAAPAAKPAGRPPTTPTRTSSTARAVDDQEMSAFIDSIVDKPAGNDEA